MGTKNNPGKYDCIAKAEPDEPIFALLARDPVAAHFVSMWAKLRVGDYQAAEVVWRDLMRKHYGQSIATEIGVADSDVDKAQEAMGCSFAMFAWIKANRPDRAL